MEKYLIYNMFKELYGDHEVAVFAPGRANIIGEHTDYNDGFVLPFAINRGVWFFAKNNNSDQLTITAGNTGEKTVIDLKHLTEPAYGWDRYFVQVLRYLSDYDIKGADIVFGGDLPIGAGISSSSAITCGFVTVLNRLNEFNFDADHIVKTAIAAERGSGVRGGIMDQYTIVNGMKNKAILLDCRSNLHKDIDINLGNYHFYLFNTNVKHNLVNTDYNNRRDQCEESVQIINKNYKNIDALRDLDIEDLPAIKNILPEILYQRSSFVIEENHRVQEAVDALQHNELDRLGRLLYASHAGLSNKYEVSCDELDWLVDYTLDKQNVFAGARMMGGGFGGCTINLVKAELDDILLDNLLSLYHKKFKIHANIIKLSLEDGILHKKW